MWNYTFLVQVFTKLFLYATILFLVPMFYFKRFIVEKVFFFVFIVKA